MPYVLRALVAPREVFAEPPAWLADSAVIALPQGFCMIPVSLALCYQFGDADRPWLYPPYSIFTNLPEALVPHLLERSRAGRLAYVEAEYHGGDGEQRSMVWEGGAVLHEAEESSGAIDDALRSLGVQPPEEGGDLFDALGLGRHRSVEDWLEEARPQAPPAAAPEPPPARARTPWWRFWR